jgi:hypothetical protein
VLSTCPLGSLCKLCDTHGLLFHALRNLRVSVCTFSLGPSSNVILGDDHMIVGTITSGLNSNNLWAHNPPQASTCLLRETTVWIVARPGHFNVCITPIPAMRDDRRSHDLDDSSRWMTEISSLESKVWISLSLINGHGRFRIPDFEILNLKPWFPL